MDFLDDEANEPELLNRQNNGKSQKASAADESRRSEYWQHYTLVIDKSGQEFAQCKYDCPT